MSAATFLDRQRHPLSAAFGDMPADEFAELVRDVKSNGLISAIVTAVDGTILDGWHRYRACVEAGIPARFEPFSYVIEPAVEGAGRTMTEVEFVVSQNAHRRHLTASQRRELIAALLKADPAKSDRAIGVMAKADHKTVAVVRREAEAGGEIPHLNKTTGSDGKTYAKATKPASETQIPVPAPAQAAPDAVVIAPAAKHRPGGRVQWKAAVDRDRAHKALSIGAGALRDVARDIHMVKLTKVALARTKLMAAIAELDRMLSEVAR